MRVKRTITIDPELWKKVVHEAEQKNISASRQVENHIKQSQQYEWELEQILIKNESKKEALLKTIKEKFT